MFRPRLRKVRLKRLFDATSRAASRRARRLVVVSSPRERDDVVAGGVDPARVRLRGNGFPEPPPPGERRSARRASSPRRARRPLRRPDRGREGVELLLEAARRLPDAHLVLAGPDDRHGTMATVRAAQANPRTAGRVHVLPPTPGPPYDLYRRATSSSSPRAARTSGWSPPRRPRSGRPSSSPTACGVAASFDEGEALVVPVRRGGDGRRRHPRARATTRSGAALAEGALRAARRSTWDAVADAQLALYREALDAG